MEFSRFSIFTDKVIKITKTNVTTKKIFFELKKKIFLTLQLWRTKKSLWLWLSSVPLLLSLLITLSLSKILWKTRSNKVENEEVCVQNLEIKKLKKFFFFHFLWKNKNLFGLLDFSEIGKIKKKLNKNFFFNFWINFLNFQIFLNLGESKRNRKIFFWFLCDFFTFVDFSEIEKITKKYKKNFQWKNILILRGKEGKMRKNRVLISYSLISDKISLEKSGILRKINYGNSCGIGELLVKKNFFFQF